MWLAICLAFAVKGMRDHTDPKWRLHQRMQGRSAGNQVSRSGNFMERYPGFELPEFRWLKVHGVPCSDDVALAKEGLGLVVSTRVMRVLFERGLVYARVEEYRGCPDSGGS